MVGPPKTLHDLRRVEAAVRVTCRSCRTVRLIDREELIRDRSARRESLEWPAVRAGLACWQCDSRDVRVDGVPFGENLPELRAHRAAMRRMNLALKVLNDAAARGSVRSEAAIALALRVLAPFLGRQELLVGYWMATVGATGDGPWNNGHQSVRWIVTRLIDLGYPVWAEFR